MNIWTHILQILWIMGNMEAGAANHPCWKLTHGVWQLRKTPENTLNTYDTVFIPVVRAAEILYMTPRGFDGVHVSPNKLINKANAVIDGAVRVILRIEIPLRCPEITDDRSAGFNPCIYNGLQSVSGSVRNGNAISFTRHQAISQLQVLHIILLRSIHTSFRNWIPRSLSLYRYERNTIHKSGTSPKKCIILWMQDLQPPTIKN